MECISVRFYVCVCAWTYTHTHSCTQRIHEYTHTRTHILTHTQTRTHIFACVHVYTNMCKYASKYVYIYTISFTHTRARTLTHTHTHTYAGLPYYYDVASGITQWDKPLDASGKDSLKLTLLSLYLVNWIQSWLLRIFCLQNKLVLALGKATTTTCPRPHLWLRLSRRNVFR